MNIYKKQSRLTKWFSVVLALAVLNLSISCSYFSVRDLPSTEEIIVNEVNNFNASEKYVIVHSNDSVWHLKDMILNDDEQTISGTIEPVSEAHIYKKERDEKRVHRYKRNIHDPLNEIHFYLKTSSSYQLNQNVSVPLKDIEKISYNDRNTGRTIANMFVGAVGITFATILIIAALKSSCPFVYIKNGQEYQFTGELYPGIITPTLQTNDYLSLPNFYQENGYYTIKVANHLKEIQYTDQLQLLLASHPKNVEVLIDSQGNFQTFSNIFPPTKIINGSQNNTLDLALKKDNNFYSFNSPQSTPNSTRYIEFEFDKPKQAPTAKLYLTAKNSMWLDYVFGKFNAQFGSYYNTFQKNQQKVKKETLNKWTNGQHIPLSVYVKTGNGWELIERLKTVGPLAMRDLVVPIDLSSIKEDTIQIRLETGFMFWEVDYVGMDFSNNLDLNVAQINPVSAIDKNGNDVTHLLTFPDQKYFVQPEIGDEVIVHFPSVVSTDSLTASSVFLKNRGYYNYIRDYDGLPDVERLKKFKEDNSFTVFAEKAYLDFINFSLNNLAQK